MNTCPTDEYSVLCEYFKLVQLINIQVDLSPDKLQLCRRFANDENQDEEKETRKGKTKY
jgi:hypothetical protein